MSAIFAYASAPKMPSRAGARLPTNRRTTLRAATSCSVQPAGTLGSAEADGATDGSTDAEADGATGADADADATADAEGAAAEAGGGAAPKLHCGVVAAWHAAT